MQMLKPGPEIKLEVVDIDCYRNPLTITLTQQKFKHLDIQGFPMALVRVSV